MSLEILLVALLAAVGFLAVDQWRKGKGKT